jgi:hypothetical protein
MPVIQLECPDCGHAFAGGVLAGTKPPEVWVCSKCLGRRCAPVENVNPANHPFDAGHAGCGCCG